MLLIGPGVSWNGEISVAVVVGSDRRTVVEIEVENRNCGSSSSSSDKSEVAECVCQACNSDWFQFIITL